MPDAKNTFLSDEKKKKKHWKRSQLPSQGGERKKNPDRYQSSTDMGNKKRRLLFKISTLFWKFWQNMKYNNKPK